MVPVLHCIFVYSYKFHGLSSFSLLIFQLCYKKERSTDLVSLEGKRKKTGTDEKSVFFSFIS